MEFLASRKRSRPRQLRKSSINTRCQSSSGHSSQLHKSSAHCRNLVSAQVWRVAAAATTTTCIFDFRLGLSLGYGLEFLPCALALERGTLHLLAIRHRLFFQNYSLLRLRCPGMASAYGWVTILLYFLWLNKHTYFSNINMSMIG